MKVDSKETDIAALILAGGKGTRMGREKALIDLGGRPLIEHVIERVAEVFDNIYLSGPPELKSFGYPVIPDQHHGMGPLAGILAGLKATGAPWVFALACDSPFIPVELLQGMASLINDNEVVVPVNKGFYEPLHALYSKSLIPLMERLIDSGEGKIKILYESARVKEAGEDLIREWDPDGMAFFNLNTPEDLVRAEEHLGVASEK